VIDVISDYANECHMRAFDNSYHQQLESDRLIFWKFSYINYVL